jgi:FMN phosphatase YigB (HAD superfamily)
MPLITFDFHNTLAWCDLWFDLEVFTLVSQVAGDLGIEVDSLAINRTYRDIRGEVMRTGVEVSAVDGALRSLASHGHDVTPDVIASSVEKLMRASLSDLHPAPGAIETVSYLHDAGYALGVISSAAHHGFVEWAIDSFGIRQCFGFILTTVSSGFYKSRPELYHQALALANARAGQSLHIGDSIKWDVETAASAGMRTGWLVSEQRHASDVKPDLVFHSLAGAGPVIDRFVRSLP